MAQQGLVKSLYYEAIVRFKVLNDGNSPTNRQLAVLLGRKNWGSSSQHLSKLEEDGRIIRPGVVAKAGIEIVGGYQKAAKGQNMRVPEKLLELWDQMIQLMRYGETAEEHRENAERIIDSIRVA